MTSQLRKLATPIPAAYIGQNDKGMDAADHTVITQLLHLYCPGWSFEVVEVLRTDVPEKQGKSKTWAGGHYVTGVVGRLTATVDGHRVVYEEAGGVENVAMHDGDGERLKHATSDAIKRCAMRLGLGLHIWAQNSYFLDRALDKHDAEATNAPTGGVRTDATAHGEVSTPTAPATPVGDPPAAGSSRSGGSARDETSSSSAAQSGDGTDPNSGPPSATEPSPDLTPAEKAKLRQTFMAVCSNVGLDYTRDVRDFLDAQYGASWSQMDAGQQRRLVERLTPADPAEKVAAQQAFKDAVVEWRAGVEGVTA